MYIDIYIYIYIYTYMFIYITLRSRAHALSRDGPARAKDAPRKQERAC